jgi:hypothetical protein
MSAVTPRSDDDPGALYTRSFDALLETHASPAVRRWAGLAALGAEAQMTASRARPHRALLSPIAAAAGIEGANWRVLSGTLDALQVLVDLTDNLTDIEEDTRRGVDRMTAYGDAPRAALFALPALLLGAVVHSLHDGFRSPWRGDEAARRLLSTLSTMIEGQAAPQSSAERVHGASGAQGAIVALPLWVLPPEAAAARHTESVEAWGRRYWEVSERWQRVLDAPGATAPRDALRDAIDALEAAWPTWTPFAHGALARAQILRAMRRALDAG